jgi:hypothetical protein
MAAAGVAIRHHRTILSDLELYRFLPEDTYNKVPTLKRALPSEIVSE